MSWSNIPGDDGTLELVRLNGEDIPLSEMVGLLDTFSLNDIQKIMDSGAIDDETYNKIRPYLIYRTRLT